MSAWKKATRLDKYRAMWGKVRKYYREHGLTPTEADAMRHKLTIKALGHDKSSLHFTNADFDAIFGVFLAITDPTNLTAQIRQLDQPDLRKEDVLARCEEILVQMGIGAQALGDEAKQRCRRGYLDSMVERFSKRTKFVWRELTEREANHLLHTLQMRLLSKKQADAKHATPPAPLRTAAGNEIPF